MHSYKVNHIKQLESEPIYVLRETAAQFGNPVMLFSGGKDSIVMAWLARKAFHPAKLPLPLLHVDTGHNFPETIAYRDAFVKAVDKRLNLFKVRDFMTADPVVLRHDDTLAVAIHKMAVGGFRHIPLVNDDGKPIGVMPPYSIPVISTASSIEAKEILRTSSHRRATPLTSARVVASTRHAAMRTWPSRLPDRTTQLADASSGTA